MGVIDLGQMQREIDALKKLLKRRGLPTDFGEAFRELAPMVRDHKHFERLLTETGPELRQELYDALVPNLRFKARPLDKYVAGAGEMAEREQLPILDAAGGLHPFRPARDVSTAIKDAEQAIAREMAQRTLTLVCAKCRRQAEFYQVGEETPLDVILKARREGWIYDNTGPEPREICPTCPTALRARHDA